MLRDRYSINRVFDEVIQLVPKMAPTFAIIDQYLEDGRLAVGWVEVLRNPTLLSARRVQTTGDGLTWKLDFPKNLAKVPKKRG